ncbi:uncharacterized protein LOC108905534 isoform X2 [Anoplophora glabripennis]|uniref:uncharacterized protein LOC108905534 isoform X2 n=1 Tax=Anoplophora glabripennis TaxID=217634 RepID=UPI000C765B0D|nr:uncharacterized protein LOC108905534 isoform X2 [Anoplophora glabripennis]
MDDDQQFCLRWNNHQSTLVAVFDTLLENGTLVDCTLAAEGKCLNAHKVVLSACSPYFEALLSRHFDKHPILILKDVKFQELKAMMDYMYRGEVNISQDQLGALLKAAESLQIKGLSDNRKGEPERKTAPVPPPPKSPQQTSALPKVQGLTIEQRSRDDSREGSLSPGPRKKKRLRRKSEELDNHDASNSSESHSLPAQNIPSSLPAASKINADVPEPVETKSDILRHKQPDDIPQVPIIKEKIETHTELMLEPKSEYVEEMNEDSIEDLTLDDDDLSNMEQLEDQAGPSHGNAGEGSSQGFGGWHMGNQSQDEVFLAAQEAVGAHRDSQDEMEEPWKTIECEASLPSKSKARYEKTYAMFKQWLDTRNLAITEQSLLQFFIERSKNLNSPSSLWVEYSILKTTININDNMNIGQFHKLAHFLKKKSIGYKVKQAKVFTRDEMFKFLREAPDDTYLMMKVVMIMGIAGACRREDLSYLTIDNVEDKGSVVIVKLPNKITKVSRMFTIIDNEEGNFLHYFRKYVNLRPKNATSRRFFYGYRQGRCVNQLVGINKIGQVPQMIANYLKLDEPHLYTGHSLRRTSATLLANLM